MKIIVLLLFIEAPLFLYAQARRITYDNVYVDYDSAVLYKNLKIIPIRPKKGFGDALPGIISLNQAIRQGLATLSERGTASTENVHWLRINNHSDKSVFVSSGEIISGGRQDRMMARDTLLVPDGKDQYIPAMCVEEGRWSDKEKKFSYSNFANPHLRKILDENKNQVLIWQEIGRQLGDNKIKNNSLGYLSRNSDKKIVQQNDDYFNYFKKRFQNTDSSILGFVCMSGDKVIGSDIFGSKELFYSQLEPLLKGYCDEAVIYGTAVTIGNGIIKLYMDKLLTDEKSQEQFLKANGKIFKQDGMVIHINSF